MLNVPGVARATRRGAAWYEALLNSVLDPLVIIDHRGVVQDASASTLRVLGWPREELIGCNVSVLMPEPHRSHHDAHLARYLRTGHTTVIGSPQELPVVQRDGRGIVCELSISRIDVPGEAAPRFIGAFRDVTRRRDVEHRLAQRERTLDAVFEQETAYLGILSLGGQVMRLNRTCLVATGMNTEATRDRLFWTLPLWGASRELQERVRGAVRTAARGSIERFDVLIETVHSGRVTADLSVKPVRDVHGEARFLLFEAHDVSALRRAQQTEMRMLRSLAEIGETAAELVHEIRNPLTGIHLALRALAGKLGESEAVLLEDLAGRLGRLEQQMRRTLQFARPEAPVLRTVEIGELLDAAVEAIAPRLLARQIELEPTLPGGGFRLQADARMVTGALVNLLLNALETGATRIRLRARAVPRRGGVIRIVVEDDGPGIPPARREAVFQPFVTDKQTGTGLGLALVRKAAEAHGGSVTIDASRLGGARFTLLLPPDGGQHSDAGTSSGIFAPVPGR